MSELVKNITTKIAMPTKDTKSPIADQNGTINLTTEKIEKVESNNGITSFEFTVTRSGNTDRTATVDYSVSGSSYFNDKTVDTAEASDFQDLNFPSGRIKFSPKETTKIIKIDVATDKIYEANEYFSINLIKALNANLGDKTSATGIILNDDEAVISLDPITKLIPEGSKVDDKEKDFTKIEFNVTISNYESPSYTNDNKEQFPSVDYSVVGFGTNPVDKSDFENNTLPSGKLIFDNAYDLVYSQQNYYDGNTSNDGNTYSKNITLSIAKDKTSEPNETFKLQLSNPIHAHFADEDSNTNVSTILNDDDTQKSSFVEFKTKYFQANEGQDQSFTLERSGDTESEVTVNYRVFGTGNADQADFVDNQFPFGSVTFKKGETLKDITIKIAQDTQDESDENYQLFLEPVGKNVKVSTDVAEGVIRNDDLGYNPNYKISGSESNDIIYGADGHDYISANGSDDLVYGGKGKDTLNGGSGVDSLHGGDNNDVLNGGDGNDSLYGENGNDRMNGDFGDDLLYGGIGNDTVNGGLGNDILYGEDGNDSISGNQGNDTLFGGAGNDIFGFSNKDNASPITYYASSAMSDDLPIDEIQDLSKGDLIYFNDRQIKKATYQPEAKANQYVIAVKEGAVSFVPPTDLTKTTTSSNVDIAKIPDLQPAYVPLVPDLTMLEDVVAVLDAQLNTAGQYAVFTLDSETYLYIDGGKATPVYYPTYYDKTAVMGGSVSAVYDDSYDGEDMELAIDESASDTEMITASSSTVKKGGGLFSYSPEIQQQDQASGGNLPAKIVSNSSVIDSNFYNDELIHIIGLSAKEVLDILG